MAGWRRWRRSKPEQGGKEMDPHGACNGVHGVLLTALGTVPLYPSFLGVDTSLARATGNDHGFTSNRLRGYPRKGSPASWGADSNGARGARVGGSDASTLSEIHDARLLFGLTRLISWRPSNGERSHSTRVFSPCGSMSAGNTTSMDAKWAPIPAVPMRWTKRQRGPSRCCDCDLRLSFPQSQLFSSFLVS